MILPVHIIAGGLGLVAGGIALYTAKGASLHRRSGMVFVYAMLTMTLTGTAIAAFQGVAPAVNIPAAVLTAYLVITALLTLRSGPAGSRCVGIVSMLVSLAIGLTSLTFGTQAILEGGARKGIPAFPFFLFGMVGLLASAGDLRIVRAGARRGAERLARHLWRMSFALFIATLSFFIGQADEFPEALRIPALLASPVVAVLLTLLYWMWRVRFRRTLRGVVLLHAPESA